MVGGLIIVVIAGGVEYVNHRVKEAVGNQVVSILRDPSTQREIAQYLHHSSLQIGSQLLAGSSGGARASAHHPTDAKASKSPQGNTDTSTAGVTSSSTQPPSSGKTSTQTPTPDKSVPTQAGPVFTSRQQLIDFAMSHFSEAEIAHYAQLYSQRKALSASEKAAIKAQILSHFTSNELAAMEQASAQFGS